jgi:hypothetical protein
MVYCGGSFGGRMSGGWNDDIDEVEGDSMLAGDGETVHNPLLLSGNKVWDTIFMKLRYSLLTSQFGFKNT